MKNRVAGTNSGVIAIDSVTMAISSDAVSVEKIAAEAAAENSTKANSPPCGNSSAMRTAFSWRQPNSRQTA